MAMRAAGGSKDGEAASRADEVAAWRAEFVAARIWGSSVDGMMADGLVFSGVRRRRFSVCRAGECYRQRDFGS